METSFQLKEILQKYLPKAKEHKILAQIFQAIRIEVNQELNVLKEFLEQMPIFKSRFICKKTSSKKTI